MNAKTLEAKILRRILYICFQNPIEQESISRKKSAPVIPRYATSPRIPEKNGVIFLSWHLFLNP